MAVFFVMYHPKEWHPNNNDQHESSESKLKTFKILNLLPKIHKPFSRFMTKSLVGPIRLIFVPALVIIAVEFKFRSRYPPNQSKPWYDWCNHYHFIFLYSLGYVLMSVDQPLLNRIMAKYGKFYLFIGTMLLCLELPNLLYPKQKITWRQGLTMDSKYCSNKDYDEIFWYIIAGFGEWMFLIGLYATTKSIYTKDMKAVIFIRQIMMPFYMTHLSVLVWVTKTIEHSSMYDKGHPELAFATNIIFSTLFTVLISFIISKMPNSVRYCFGLPSKDKTTTKKYLLVEYSPIILLIIGRIIGYHLVEYQYHLVEYHLI